MLPVAALTPYHPAEQVSDSPPASSPGQPVPQRLCEAGWVLRAGGAASSGLLAAGSEFGL